MCALRAPIADRRLADTRRPQRSGALHANATGYSNTGLGYEADYNPLLKPVNPPKRRLFLHSHGQYRSSGRSNYLLQSRRSSRAGMGAPKL
jgi:hypothetical protein